MNATLLAPRQRLAGTPYALQTRGIFVDDEGNVGIGTTTPEGNLHVTGADGVIISTSIAPPTLSLIDDADGDLFKIQHSRADDHLRIRNASNTDLLVIEKTGNVGIGTTSPAEALHVCGNIRAEGDITASGGVTASIPGACPDYVFESDYELMPLDELSNYIQRNKHLPNVPSAEVVERDGIDLGGFSMRLLEKTEELTLYVLDQDKRLKEKDAELAELRQEKDSEIQALSDRLAKLERLIEGASVGKGELR